MSVKIVTGSILDVGDSLRELQGKIGVLREEALNAQREIGIRMVAEIVTRRIDRQALGLSVEKGDDEQCGPLLFVIKAVLERQRELEKDPRKREIDVDLGLEVSIHPLPGKLLAIAYYEREEIGKIWWRQAWVKDYHYQNSCDKPKEIPEVVWDLRRRDWDDALGNDTPAECGFTARILYPSLHYIPQADDVLGALPALETRRSWAKGYAESEIIIRRLREISPTPSAMQYNQALKWTQSEEGEALINTLAAVYAQQLPAEITREMLLGEGE
jgi:hypothetical protein